MSVAVIAVLVIVAAIVVFALLRRGGNPALRNLSPTAGNHQQRRQLGRHQTALVNSGDKRELGDFRLPQETVKAAGLDLPADVHHPRHRLSGPGREERIARGLGSPQAQGTVVQVTSEWIAGQERGTGLALAARHYTGPHRQRTGPGLSATPGAVVPE